jgi:hypothetical protein
MKRLLKNENRLGRYATQPTTRNIEARHGSRCTRARSVRHRS